MPRFSVLMANYNNGKYIAQAIESVLHQTFRDWELVIIDDNSRDNSIKIINDYRGDKRIRFYKNETNLGYIGTLKKLIVAARAEIVGVLDSDDSLAPQAIKRMLEAYQQHPDCGFIYSQYMVCDEKLRPLRRGHCRAIPPGKSNLHHDSVSHFKTFKKQYYLQTDGYDEEILYAEDVDIIYKLEEVTKFYFINQPLYFYRILPDSQTHQKKKLLISRMNVGTAKYRAFIRRLGGKLPNLTSKEMSDELFWAIPYCLRTGNWRKAFFFWREAVRLCPINIRAHVILLARIIKFIPYRIYIILREGIL